MSDNDSERRLSHGFMRRMTAAESSLTPLESQNLQRLRINRVALVQELKVEHVLKSLTTRGVLTDGDCKFIVQGPSPKEQAQRLLDVLPTKGRKADWYRHFREALRCPDTANSDTLRQYRVLTEFLDSTLVSKLHQEASAGRTLTSRALLPRFAALPAISLQPDGKVRLTKGDDGGEAAHPPDPSPTAGDGSLYRDGGPARSRGRGGLPAGERSYRDKEGHVAAEQAVFRNMRKVEASHAQSWSRGVVPVITREGRDAVEEDSVIQMLLDADNYFVYLKYLAALRAVRSVDILKDVAAAFPKLRESIAGGGGAREPKLELTSRVGVALSSFLQDIGSFDEASEVLAIVADCLGGGGSGPAVVEGGSPVTAWRLLYGVRAGSVELLRYRGDYVRAHSAGRKGAELRSKLDLVSFGKKAVDGTLMALNMHALHRDSGRWAAANEWLRKAVQELDFRDHGATVKVLCAASQAYVFRGSLSRAEILVTQAVRLAKSSFGALHPLYIHALLHYVLFSNHVRQDDVGLAAARHLVALGERVYGPNTAHAAVLHQALAGAALGADSDGGESACRHARKALVTLLAALKGQATPAVASVRELLGRSLVRRAAALRNGGEEEEERSKCLEEAEVELSAALEGNVSWSGSASYQAAMSRLALGELAALQKKWSTSVQFYEEALETLSKCSLPVGNSAVHVVKTALGRAYASANRSGEAVPLLEYVTDSFNTQGYPLKWYASAYQSLAACREALGDADGARETEARLVAWSWDAEDNVASRHQSLDGEPVHDLASLFSEASMWREEYVKVLAGLRGSRKGDGGGAGRSAAEVQAALE